MDKPSPLPMLAPANTDEAQLTLIVLSHKPKVATIIDKTQRCCVCKKSMGDIAIAERMLILDGLSVVTVAAICDLCFEDLERKKPKDVRRSPIN
ncbi:MAG: hypothetical protein WAN65_00680 [Candidatus Sulfotelmatobacter sp.]